MKKKTVLEQNPDDQKDLLQFVGSLPPIWMIEAAKTDDQKESVSALWGHFQHLRVSLAAYFSGQKNPIEDPQIRASVEADMRHYLAFYNLVWYGWREIESEVQSSELGDAFPYQQPGDVLKGLLQWECIRGWQVITGKSFVPNNRETMALMDGKVLLKPKTGQAEKRRERTLEYGRETFGDGGVAPKLAALCEFAVNKRLRSNSTLREVLEDYRKAKKNRSKATKKLLRG
jgi:hypothetical protein